MSAADEWDGEGADDAEDGGELEAEIPANGRSRADTDAETGPAEKSGLDVAERELAKARAMLMAKDERKLRLMELKADIERAKLQPAEPWPEPAADNHEPGVAWSDPIVQPWKLVERKPEPKPFDFSRYRVPDPAPADESVRLVRSAGNKASSVIVPKPIIGDFLAAGQFMGIVGQTGVGKSVLAIQAGLSLVHQGEFLGLKCNQKWPVVLYVSAAFEDDIGQVAARVDAVTEGLKISSDAFATDHFNYVCLETKDDEFVQNLNRAIDELDCAVRIVLIDPLVHFVSTTANCRDLLRHQLAPLLRDSHAVGIVNMHTGKNTAGQGAYSAAGDSDLGNFMRMIWEVEGSPTDEFFTFRCVKRHQHLDWRDADGKRTNAVQMRHSPDGLLWLPVATEAFHGANVAADLLPLFPPGKVVERSEALKLANDHGCGGRRAKAFLTELVETGLLERIETPRSGTRPLVSYRRKMEAKKP